MLKPALIAAALVMAGTAAASAKTLNIALDGYCNVFTLDATKVTIGGSRAGCGESSPIIEGGTIASVKSVPYTITSDSEDLAEVFTWYFGKAKHGAGSWILYESTGGASTEFNSGTYTETTSKLAHPGLKNATARH